MVGRATSRTSDQYAGEGDVQTHHLATDDSILDPQVVGDRRHITHREQPRLLGPRCRLKLKRGHSTAEDSIIQVRQA
jgi:hypothetical protein